eukprot:scaffold46208_cov12-Prasinocladus_malaysianus.AAC.1
MSALQLPKQSYSSSASLGFPVMKSRRSRRTSGHLQHDEQSLTCGVQKQKLSDRVKGNKGARPSPLLASSRQAPWIHLGSGNRWNLVLKLLIPKVKRLVALGFEEWKRDGGSTA